MGNGRIVEDGDDLQSSSGSSGKEATVAIRSKIERQVFIMKDLLDECGE